MWQNISGIGSYKDISAEKIFKALNLKKKKNKQRKWSDFIIHVLVSV